MGPIDPHVYIQQVARKMAEPGALTDRKEIETMLDEVEYLYDILDPEMQDGAEQLIAQLRARLEKAV
jgi:hypothetical protein